MPQDLARTILTADYRPPIRRGDLATIAVGSVVGLIDGVFEQDLAVSPREVHEALARGVRIFGAASMGALRAAEVPGVVGIGEIYNLYARGSIDRDDEVALLFDPDASRSITEPLVNIRFAVERLVRSGTIAVDLGRRIIAAARGLHYSERVYPRILSLAGIPERERQKELEALLRAFDLKRNDAQSLLETLAALPPTVDAVATDDTIVPLYQDHFAEVRAPTSAPHDAPLLVWEYGEPISFAQLTRFLKMTGTFRHHAWNAVARFVLSGNELETPPRPDAFPETLVAQDVFDRVQFEWGWHVGEEAEVTLGDLGMGLGDLGERVDEEAKAVEAVRATACAASPEFAKALRAQLMMDDLALKREAIRCGSLALFAAEGLRLYGPPRREEIAHAQRVTCRLLHVPDFEQVLLQAAAWGLDRSDAEAFVAELASARQVGGELLRRMVGQAPARRNRSKSRAVQPRGQVIRLVASPKASGDPRFSLPIAEAHAIVKKLAKTIGVTRVSLIGELSDMGVHVAQACRPDSAWSSTLGSGKSESRRGARIGSIMEEVEKYAQDRFPSGDAAPEIVASYADISNRASVVNPRTLDLPYDTVYDDNLPIGWRPVFDLLTEQPVYVPSAAIVAERLRNDIYYSRRGARKLFDTNGLASGFTFEEALVHATCEVIERHATKIAELIIDNPGGFGPLAFKFVDLSTVPASSRRLINKLKRAGRSVRVLDITSEVRVPTFLAVIYEDLFVVDLPIGRFGEICHGYASHPNPETAISMALLEAAQTRIGNAAGGREDLTIQARSLGRHERARPNRPWANSFFFGSDPMTMAFDATVGLRSADSRDDQRWILSRLREAGVESVLVAEYTVPEILPARALRVLIPGLETINPFYSGPRSRALALTDLLPRPRISPGLSRRTRSKGMR